MTLAELIEKRSHKFDKEIGVSCSDYWNGYKTGWYWAYQDFREILEHHGFDMNIAVIDVPSNKPTREEHEYALHI